MIKLSDMNPHTTTYYVTCAAAKMPTSCWGTYRRVAVMAWDSTLGPRPKTIRDTRAAVVVDTWEKLNVGVSERCAYSRAYGEALTRCEALEAERRARIQAEEFCPAI